MARSNTPGKSPDIDGHGREVQEHPQGQRKKDEAVVESQKHGHAYPDGCQQTCETGGSRSYPTHAEMAYSNRGAEES